MQNKNVVIALALVLVLSLSLVAAQDSSQMSILDKISFFFRGLISGGNTFTIVGQLQSSSTYPDRTWDVLPGQFFEKDASAYCSSGHGLFNVYINNYIPLFEQSDMLKFTCQSDSQKCIAGVYCTPYGFPETQQDCDQRYPGSHLATSTQTDQYMPFVDINLQPITSFKYCDQSACTNQPPITCWASNSAGSNCDSRTYDCTYETYPNCPTTRKYTSQSSCLQDLFSGIPGGKGDTRITDFSYTFSGNQIDDTFNINVKVKNFGSAEDTINIRGDIFQNTGTGLFSITEPMQICNPTSNYEQERKIYLAPNEEQNVEIKVVPIYQTFKTLPAYVNLTSKDFVLRVGLFRDCSDTSFINNVGYTQRWTQGGYGAYAEKSIFVNCNTDKLRFYCGVNSPANEFGKCENNILSYSKSCTGTVNIASVTASPTNNTQVTQSTTKSTYTNVTGSTISSKPETEDKTVSKVIIIVIALIILIWIIFFLK